MKKLIPWICFVVLLLAIFVPAGMALASYNYSVSVRVFNNSTTDYDDGLPVLVSINNSQMYGYGYIDTDGLNTDVQEGTTSRTFMVDSEYLGIFIPSFLGGQVRNSSYRLGNVPGQTAFPIITGVGGNVTISDAAALEPTDNFSVEIKGLFDTSYSTANQTHVDKTDAFSIINGASENITAQIYKPVTKVRYYASNNGGNFTLIDIDVYVGGVWTDLHQGALAHQVWTEIACTIPATGARVSVYNDGGGAFDGVLYEFAFEIDAGWVSPTSAADPSDQWADEAKTYDGDTGTFGIDAAVPAGSWSAFIELYPIVNIEVSASGLSSGVYDIEAGLTSPFLWLAVDATDPQPPVADSLQLNAPLLQAECSSSPFTTIDSNEHTATVTGAVWTLNEGYYFDGNNDIINIPYSASIDVTDTFTGMIWFKSTENRDFKGLCGKVGADAAIALYRPNADVLRLHFNDGAGSAAISTDDSVWDGEWHCVFFGGDGTNKFIDVADLGTLKESPKTRVPSSGAGFNWIIGRYTASEFAEAIIGEFMLYDRYLTSEERLQNYNATKSKYNTGDIYTYSTLATVPDNSNDWILGDAMSYITSYKEYVGGVLKCWFEPNTMIAGSIVTDRAGGDHNGTINWGSNPAGIEVTLGSLTSVASTTSPSSISAEAPALLPDFPQGETTPTPEDAELTAMPQFVAVSSFADSLGMPVRAAYVILIWLTCMVMGVACTVAFSSVWGFVGGYGFGNMLALGTPVWPQLLVVAVLMTVIMGVFLWRHN